MFATLIGVVYFGEGGQMEAVGGEPLNMAGLALAIVSGVLYAVSTVCTVLFGIRAYKLGRRVGLIPVIAGLAGGLLLIPMLIQVIGGLATGNWS